MNRKLENIEFFCYESEVWYRLADGTTSRLTMEDTDIVMSMEECISTFYPKAYAALQDRYIASKPNGSFYRFRMVCRFIRCNFLQLDDKPDITKDLHFNFEYISCPLRGECEHDNVICRPQFDHRLSQAEMRVMGLVYEGMSEETIAQRLSLALSTVHNHIYNAYKRLGIHSRVEFVRFASLNNLFYDRVPKVQPI